MTNYQHISKLPLFLISGSLIFADRQAYAFQTLISAYGKFGHRVKRRFFFFPMKIKALEAISRSRSREIQDQCGVRGKISSRFCCWCRYKTRSAADRLGLRCAAGCSWSSGQQLSKSKVEEIGNKFITQNRFVMTQKARGLGFS